MNSVHFRLSNQLPAGIALLWSLFQLGITQLAINDTLVRSIHLAFALVLTFLLFPGRKRHTSRTTSLISNMLSVLAGCGALYLLFDYNGIALRPGLPLQRDIVMGVLTVILLLEATRRTLGPALAVIASVFLAYCLFGPYLPDLIAHRGASINKLVSHMYLTTEGIFGVPLRVSASFVFLFVLFGALLDKAGAGRYFIQISISLLGRFRGGPAKAAVAASGLTGMVSGSSIANTVTTGAFTIPLMKKVGFPAEKAAAVEVAASTNGQLMPPIMGAAAFIIAEFLGIAYLDVVKAALIPAVISYLGLFLVVHLESERLKLKPMDKADLPPFRATLFSGLHHLLPVLVLILSLALFHYSATLAAFNACILVMIMVLIQSTIGALRSGNSVFIGLKEGLTSLIQGLISGAKQMIPVAVATASAGIVVGAITLTGLGQRLLEVVETLAMGHLSLVLLLTALTSLILGMGLPTTANYIVMASLTAPIIVELGQASGLLVPALAAHLFVFYFGILADDTPPVGLAAYAAAGIAKSDPIKTGIQGFTYDLRTAILPFMFLFNTDLILIQGVRVGGSPLSPGDWIWISDWWLAGFIFIQALGAMFAFIHGIMGWMNGPLNWPWRIGLLGLCLGLFRPELLGNLVGIEENYLVAGTALIILAGFMAWRRKTCKTG
ncbi:MAG: TRAP transporter permease [Magnetococcales bacterium]|nr:TRAP transporter permease [Magnetococcales bacterium]